MADLKITELDENTTPASTDIVAIVDDPSGTPATEKMTLATLDTHLSATTKTLTNKTLTSPVINTGVSGTAVKDEDDMTSDSATALATQQSIKAYVDDGWLSVGDTWEYLSATTITVPSGAASKYSKGDKIKLTQTTVKYFYIVGVADTVLTITGGSDYTLVDATITDNYYSHASSPIGFPGWFNYTAAYDGFSVDPTDNVNRFKLDGNICFFNLRSATNGTSDSPSFSISIPITAKTITNENWGGAIASYIDNGSLATVAGRWSISSGGTTVGLFADMGLGGFTTSGGKRATLQGFYEI